MIRIAALNYSSSEEDSQDAQERAATKEAEESEAFMLYNRALSLQRQGSNEKAEDAFRELLEHPFITEALELLGDNVEGSTHPALQLLYSIHKNIANMALHRYDHKAAILSYIEAVKIDTTEVTVWYKIGTIAKQIYNFPLARMGFELGLQCNPNHWPCLDNVITLLYAMNDYWYCLYYISKALEKDHGYTKGLVLRNQIYKEDPSLKETTNSMFKNCDPSIDSVEIDREEKEEFINESLKLAEERRKLARPKQSDLIKLPSPIQSYTWCGLGEALLALYKMIKSSDPPLSMGRRVDLSAYNGEESSNVPSEEQPMETDHTIPKSASDHMEVGEVEEQLDPKTVTSLEQFLSNLPAEQMTELLQSTPPTQTSVSTTLQDPIITFSSPMETDYVSPAEGLPKVTVTPDNLPKQNGIAEISGTPTDNSIGDNIRRDYSPSAEVSKDVIAADSLPRNLFSTDNLSKSKAIKRKKGTLLEDLGGKRRSARVRNTSKRKEEDCVNFQGLLLTFLPQSLRDYDEEISKGGSLQPVEQISTSSTKTTESEVTAVSLCDTEEADIRQLLLTMQKNSGCLDLMMQFIFILADKTHYKWPVGLAAIYLKVYKMTRKHFDLPDTYSDDEIDDNLLELGKTLLLCSELQLDHWTVTKSRFLSFPRQPQSPGIPQLKVSDLPAYYYDDEYFMAGMISRSDVFRSFWSEYCSRVYWMKARFFMLQGKMEDAVFFFKKTLGCLQELTEDGSSEEIRITLPNCCLHNVLSIEKVDEQLKSLERSQSFEETQRLYDAGKYEKVVECILKTNLNQVSMTTSATERRSQLILLQESLIKLEDYKRAFLWSEIALDEAIRGYKMSSASEKEQWADILVQTCDSLTLILKKDKNAISDLPVLNQSRLSHNLIYMIDVEMSVPETCSDMPIGTVLPWILLYKLIEKEETKAPKASHQIEAGELDRTIPASLMLLNIAHEYLGRHAWCTKSDGEFLLFYINVLTSESYASNIFNEELGQAVEQCFYCLYGHPTKKGRYRHLVDHNSPWVQFTWERAAEIFEYFKPKTLPEFDSYKTDAVAGEVEHLLRRICELVPESQKPIYVVDSLQGYIEGTTDVFDEESIYNPSPVSQELYYLLADYYFKNNDQAKAIKYYCNDICVNPKRLDSWAGMALARMSQLEQKLNSNELRMDFPVHKKSISALRCFRRALQIDDSNGKLWIEYGSLAYQLYSHSARQLKWKDSFPLSSEMEQIATDSRQEMLHTSYNCYKKAIECENEEEWIQHYMIGKCLEKMKKPVEEYLRHYEESAECLYEENAPYPKKITYCYTTSHLAVESLELFYRLHASILKILLSKHLPDTDYELFERFVNKAARSPFACAKQKNEESVESKDFTSVDGKETDSSKRSSSMSQDHTYSKQKQDRMSSLLQKSTGVESIDNSSQSLQLQKPSGVISLDNSSQSCSDSVSQESICVSSESVSQSKDVSSDVSGELSSQPMEIGVTTEEDKMSITHQTEINFSDNNLTQKQSESRTLELSTNAIIEEITDMKQYDPSLMMPKKYSQIEKLKKMDFNCDSPLSISSSDMFEDEDGNITVTAKIETIGRSSSSEGEVGMATIEARQSFGFEPMITDDTDQPKEKENLQTNSVEPTRMYTEESSQDIRYSVDKTLENLVSTVETVDDMVLEVTAKLAVIKETTDAEKWNSEKCEISNDDLNLEKKHLSDTKIVEQNNGISTGELHNLTKDTSVDDNNDNRTGENPSKRHADYDGPQNEADRKIEDDTMAVDITTRSRITSLCPAYDSISSEDEQKSGTDNSNKSDNTKVEILCPEYESISSEDEGMADDQKVKNKVKGAEEQEVHVSANVSLCADYESLSSESEDSGREENENSGKTESIEIKKEDEIKIVNKSFDDRNYSQNQSVNVLEISEGGISGDVTMQENKFLEIIKNEEQMAKLTPVNEDDKKAPIAEIEQKDLTIEKNIENNIKTVTPKLEDLQVLKNENLIQEADINTTQPKEEAMDVDSPFIATNDNAGQTVLTDSQVDSPFSTTNVSTGQTILTDSEVNSLFSATNVSTSQTILTDSEVDSPLSTTKINTGQTILTDSKNINTAYTGSILKTEDKMEVEEQIKEHTSTSELSVNTPNTENHLSSSQNKKRETIERDVDSKIINDDKNSDSEIKDDVEKEMEKNTDVDETNDVTVEVNDKISEAENEKQTTDSKMEVDYKISEEENGKQSSEKEKNDKEGDIGNKEKDDKEGDTGNKEKDDKEGDTGNKEKDDTKNEETAEKNTTPKLSGKTGKQLHKLLIEKCMAALHLCLSRFPTHYKSIYRLADVYVNSPYHKNLKFAQELLLGVPNWQQQSHMPAQGLFGDRKQMNFFQGIWRIPIGDIDRSGSFASHMNRSVLLLIRVLKERKELSMMYQIHLWMNRSPESGKKYLRDSERMLFVKMSFQNCWQIIDERNKELSKISEKEKAEKILMEVYKIWNYGNSSKMRSNTNMDTNHIFAETYKAVMKDKVVPDRPLVKQAVDFCQHYNSLAKTQMQKANQEGQNVGTKSDSSIFSPSRSQFPSFSPAKQSPIASQSMTESTPPQQKQVFSTVASHVSAADKMKLLSATVSSSAVSKPSTHVMNTSNLTESVKNVLPRTDKHEHLKKLSQKSSALMIQQKDPKLIQKKPVTKPAGKEPVVETLVGEITSASIFETLLANEFGNKSAPDKDEVDGTVKQQPQPITSKQPVKQQPQPITSKQPVKQQPQPITSKQPVKQQPHPITSKQPVKQTIIVTKPNLQPIICKVDDTRGGLNIVSPEFGSLEVLTPNTPCPDTVKFSIPSKDPKNKTKTTIVITKRKPPLNITEPIEISSSDDGDDNDVDYGKQEVTPTVIAMPTVVSMPSTSKQQPTTTSIDLTLKKQQTAASIDQTMKTQQTTVYMDPTLKKTFMQGVEKVKEISKPTQMVSRSVIQLEEILDSADDSIPSSSESGSVYVPDDSSSDSIPSSPEPTKLRLDEVTGLFIPSDVKFFNDNQMLDNDD